MLALPPQVEFVCAAQQSGSSLLIGPIACPQERQGIVSLPVTLIITAKIDGRQRF